MPNYYGAVAATVPSTVPVNVPTDLKAGDSCYLFGKPNAANAGGSSDATTLGEQPAVPQASIPISITNPVQGGPPPMVTFDFAFYATGTLNPAAPGAFEIDIQEADEDIDSDYILPSNASYKITALAASAGNSGAASLNRCRVDLSPTGGRFMRIVLISRANAVDLVAKATRLA